MNHPIRLKTATPPLLITLTLLCFGILPIAQAVVPAPDGGYPGQNTAEGQNALFSLTTGGFNTANGWLSLRAVTTGSFNTAVGAGTLVANTGNENTATGTAGLLSNTAGIQNTANGAFALLSNTEGSFNTATGDQALLHNTMGSVNTAIGAGALANNTTGDHNTAIGGDFVLFSNTTGSFNTATGVDALAANTTGDNNTAFGSFALTISTGGYNTAIGSVALNHNTTGSGNIALGFDAGQNVTTANNVICIGTDGNNLDNACYIGQIFSSTVSASAVFVDSNGRLGTMTSSKRFKQNIKPMNNASEALYSLKPVSFRYKKEFDAAGTSQLGLVAEDVDKVNPDLIVRDKKGKPYSVRYDQVNAMLLNEFLKEHTAFVQEQHKVEKLEATVASLVTMVKEQAAQMQKVSAQLEASKPAPQVVNNP